MVMPRRETILAAALVFAGVFSGARTVAQDAEAAPADACGKTLSPAVMAAWAGVGGQDGRLGCPVESEGDTATSIKGTAARDARFRGGEIVRHMSGPLAGKAFAVQACDRLYVQYGGVSGWLGLPTSDAINTPDGQTQHFEGGTLRRGRALDECEAEKG
jgi:uncharacterized protein with LGFP repeats